MYNITTQIYENHLFIYIGSFDYTSGHLEKMSGPFAKMSGQL